MVMRFKPPWPTYPRTSPPQPDTTRKTESNRDSAANHTQMPAPHTEPLSEETHVDGASEMTIEQMINTEIAQMDDGSENGDEEESWECANEDSKCVDNDDKSGSAEPPCEDDALKEQPVHVQIFPSPETEGDKYSAPSHPQGVDRGTSSVPHPVRLVTLVHYNGSLGYAWIDRAHTLVCGQTATSEVWLKGTTRGSWGQSNSTTKKGAAPSKLQQAPHYNLKYFGLKRAQAVPSTAPNLVSKELPPSEVSDYISEGPMSSAALPKSINIEAHSDALLDTAVSILVTIGLEAACACLDLSAEALKDSDDACESVTNPYQPATIHVVYPAGALHNDASFIAAAVESAQRLLLVHITDQLRLRSAKVEGVSTQGNGSFSPEEHSRLCAPSYLPLFEVHYTPCHAFSTTSARSSLQQLWPDVPLTSWSCKIDLTCEGLVLALSGACNHILSLNAKAPSSGPSGGIIGSQYDSMAVRVTAAMQSRAQPTQHESGMSYPQLPLVGPLLVADVAQHPGSSCLLHVDEGTYDSLQVFRTDSHPAAIFSLGAAKEGLSLYSLLARKAVSPLGKELLRQWLAMPTCDPTTLHHRLEQVSFFVHFLVHGGMQVPINTSDPHKRHHSARGPQNVDLIPFLDKLLRRVQHPDYLINRFRLQRHSATDYKALLLATTALLDICKILAPFAEICPSVKVLLDKCQPDAARRLVERISTTIDLELCDNGRQTAGKGAQNKGKEKSKLQALLPSTARATGAEAPILRNVSPQLDQLRDCYNSIDFDAFLAAAARKELDQLPPYYCSRWKVSVAFMPHLGYLAVVDLGFVLTAQQDVNVGQMNLEATPFDISQDATHSPTNQSPSLQFPEGWEFVFQSTEQCFCRTALTRELDTNIGDLHTAIREVSAGILRSLENDIMALSHCLSSTRFIAEIDACLALAKVAVEEGWSRPVLTNAPNVAGPSGGSSAQSPLQSYDSQGIYINGGFHPLLNRATPHPIIPFNLNLSHHFTLGGDNLNGTEGQSVPNKPLSPTDDRRVVVLTGPHGSGKSICQRAVGIIALLAHIGSYVPAAHAVIPLAMDHIVMIDASTPETLTMGNIAGKGPTVPGGLPPQINNEQHAAGHSYSSAFGKELAAVCRALNSVTNNSLILVDEFGKGTLAADGVAILASVLGQLADSTPQRDLSLSMNMVPLHPPHPIPAMAIFTTHYTEIFEEALVSPDFIAWKHMTVLVVVDEADNDTNRGPSSDQQSTWGSESTYRIARKSFSDGQGVAKNPRTDAARQLQFGGGGSEDIKHNAWSDLSPSRSMLPSIGCPSLHHPMLDSYAGSPYQHLNAQPLSPADTLNRPHYSDFRAASEYDGHSIAPSSKFFGLSRAVSHLSRTEPSIATTRSAFGGGKFPTNHSSKRKRTAQSKNTYNATHADLFTSHYQMQGPNNSLINASSGRAQQLIQNTYLTTGQRLVSPHAMPYFAYSPDNGAAFRHQDPTLASPFNNVTDIDNHSELGQSPAANSFHSKSGYMSTTSEGKETACPTPKVIYLYELESCSLQKMFRSALETARVAGVPHIILNRAAEILEGFRSGELLGGVATKVSGENEHNG